MPSDLFAAEADAALLNGHMTHRIREAMTTGAAEADAALLNGHRVLPESH